MAKLTRGEADYKLLEAVIAERLMKQKATEIDLNGIITINQNGRYQITWNNETHFLNHKLGERIMAATPNGDLGHVNIKTLITKGDRMGKARQMGLYFEYKVYMELLEAAKQQMPEADVFAQMTVPSLSFLGQGTLLKGDKLATLKASVDAAAKEAANLLAADLGKNIVEALAGNRPGGDLLLGDLTLELKFYQDPSNIVWYSFSDQILGYKMSIVTKEEGLWRQPGEEKEKRSPWLTKIRSQGLAEYMKKVEENFPGGSSPDSNLFMYLLQKGKHGFDNKNKKILVGQSVTKQGSGKVKVVLTMDIAELTKQTDTNNITGKMDLTEMKYKLMLGGQEMGSIDVNSQALSKRAIPDHHYHSFEPWKENTTYMNFYLSHNFFAPKENTPGAGGIF